MRIPLPGCIPVSAFLNIFMSGSFSFGVLHIMVVFLSCSSLSRRSLHFVHDVDASWSLLRRSLICREKGKGYRWCFYEKVTEKSDVRSFHGES